MGIVERLRKEIGGYTDKYLEEAEANMREAADEIERLREALNTIIANGYYSGNCYCRDCNKLRAALEGK